jgi:hypothetical protein
VFREVLGPRRDEVNQQFRMDSLMIIILKDKLLWRLPHEDRGNILRMV